MTNTKNTYKTIGLLSLLCLLLVTTLIVYRTQQNTNIKFYTSENATMFPVGLEIKPFKLSNAIGGKFSNKDFFGNWTLVFFGFTHCANVCPATMDMLAHAYDKLVSIRPNIKVVLVSLDPSRDKHELLADYVARFHPKFIGVTGQLNEIRKLQAELHVYSEQTQNDGDNYQIQHTSSIFLVNPKGEWAGLFSYGLTSEQFAYEFEMATHAAA